MKRYLTYIILATLTLLASGCKKETDADRKDLESRQRVPISVSYSDAGTAVTNLAFPHGAVQKEITVDLNNENIHWNIESDKDWCRIIPDTHIGPGSFFIEIDANEGFDAREDATLTFVAGEYRGSTLRVSQSGSAFIISHPFLLSPKGELDYEVDVTTLKDAQWDIEYNEWINVEEINADSDESTTTKTLKIWAADNDGDSRYGIITLTDLASGDKDEIALYQFGKDFQYDSEDRIFFPNDEPAGISFVAPPYVIKTINAPAYATTEMSGNDDGTVTISIAFEENLSDCEMLREIPVSIVLNNAALSSINLPPMVQDFLPAGGLMTAAGLKAFAAKVAAGESTESWETEGEVKVLQDIDMNGVDDWAGIGSAEHPFAGVFDGGSHSIVNLESNTPLFNACEGATVKNISLDKHCALLNNTNEKFGGIAVAASGSTFDHCTFAGSIVFLGKSFEDTYIGGILGEADAYTVVRACKMNGSITISSQTTAAEGLNAHIGGLVGHNLGSIINSEMNGTINLNSGHNKVNAGGITPLIPEGASLSGNAFTGTIELKGAGKFANIGGIVAYAPSGSLSFDYTSDKSATSGTINIKKYLSDTGVRIFAGGFIGLIGEGVSLSAKGYTTLTNFNLDYTEQLDGEYICTGGFLGACEPDALAGELTFEDITNEGALSNLFASNAVHVRRNCVGGVAGLVNGAASFTRCINKGKMDNAAGSTANNGRSNNYTMIMGGIAGHCYGADMSFTNCENRIDLTNNFYSNNFVGNTYGNYYSATATGGIIGAFNYKPNPQAKKVTVSNCVTKGNLCAIRGFIGGIAGYAYGASFSNCSWEGNSKHLKTDKSDNQAAYKGGIAGALGNGTVDDCTAKSDMDVVQYGSSPSADAGGIVAHIMESAAEGDKVEIKNSSWYGHLSGSRTTQGTLVTYLGGVVGLAQDNTIVKDCKFGGAISGLEITQNSVSNCAVGNIADCECTVSGISLWNGI